MNESPVCPWPCSILNSFRYSTFLVSQHALSCAWENVIRYWVTVWVMHNHHNRWQSLMLEEAIHNAETYLNVTINKYKNKMLFYPPFIHSAKKSYEQWQNVNLWMQLHLIYMRKFCSFVLLNGLFRLERTFSDLAYWMKFDFSWYDHFKHSFVLKLQVYRATTCGVKTHTHTQIGCEARICTGELINYIVKMSTWNTHSDYTKITNRWLTDYITQSTTVIYEEKHTQIIKRLAHIH